MHQEQYEAYHEQESDSTNDDRESHAFLQVARGPHEYISRPAIGAKPSLVHVHPQEHLHSTGWISGRTIA
jgi:hypothetical protein